MANLNTKIVTPPGVSQYAFLNSPDTRFDEVGVYKTNLIVDTDKASSLITSINKEIEKSVTLAKEKAKGKQIKKAPEPFFEEVDDEGNPTGKIVFKFKCKAQITTKDGKLIPNRVAIFDSALKPMVDSNVWSGSELKVSAELIPYYTAMAGAGVSMRLKAVQVLTLVEGGNSNGKGYGFAETSGYEHQQGDMNVSNSLEESEETDF